MARSFWSVKDNTVGDDRQYKLLFFLEESCEFLKTLNTAKKDTLLKTMINLGIMSALKVSVHMQDSEVRLASEEIFTYLADYNPRIV